MQVYDYRDASLLVFWPTVVSGEVELDVSLVDNPGATMQSLDCCDHVLSDMDPTVSASVDIRVKDLTGYVITVFASENASQWARLPSGTPTHGQWTESVPGSANAEKSIAVLIRAVPSGGGAELRRSQVVIIKHRPN